MKDKLLQVLVIFFDIDPKLYEVEYVSVPKEDEHWDNHKKVYLKKINGDYFNDPKYMAESFDLEPITLKDGGFYPDKYAGKKIKSYCLREDYNHSHLDRFPRSERKFNFNEVGLETDIKKYKELLSKIKE